MESYFRDVFPAIVDKMEIHSWLRSAINRHARLYIFIGRRQNHDVVNGFSKAVVHLESIPARGKARVKIESIDFESKHKQLF